MTTTEAEAKINDLKAMINAARDLCRDMRTATDNLASHGTATAQVIEFKTR